MKKAFWKNIAFGAIGVGILLLVWLVAQYAVGNELLVPNLFSCLKKGVELLFDGAFWLMALSSLKRVLIAFCVSFVSALVFALVAYLYPVFAKIVAPIMSVLRATPVLGLLLIIWVWTDSHIAPMVVAFLSLFPMLYAEMFSALKGVDKGLIEMSKAYKVPVKRQITALYLPSVLPHILRQGGAALSFGVKLVVSVEVIVYTSNSLGNTMKEMLNGDETSTFFALIILACVFAFVIESAFIALSKGTERREK